MMSCHNANSTKKTLKQNILFEKQMKNKRNNNKIRQTKIRVIDVK